MLTREDAEALARDVPAVPFVAGSWHSGRGLRPVEVTDPVTERPLAAVAEAGADLVDAAVRAARHALTAGAWGQLDGAARGALLGRVADLLDARREDLAALESLEVGKPGLEPRMIDLPQAIRTFRYFAGWADKITGRTIPTPGYLGQPTLSYTVREPAGVVAAITPWNSPTMIGAWKLAPALAAGCAVVLKPPEDAPLTSLLLAELCHEAGFPPGAVSVLPGRGETTGRLLAEHPGVDKISFTGSPRAGLAVAIAATKGFRRTTLELGGKSPQIVFADADLDAAADGVAAGIFANQGQVCAAGSRILVDQAIRDEMTSRLLARAGQIVLGDPFDKDTTMGPLISQAQFDRVSRYVQLGKDEGARLLGGGERPPRTGYFIQPALFTGVSSAMTIAREEIFGPVGTIITFRDEDEAVAIANDSDYALAATLWTSDVSRAHAVARRIRAGAVAVNGWSPLDAALPWGGSRLSGHGRELGWPGIEANTEEKTITIIL